MARIQAVNRDDFSPEEQATLDEILAVRHPTGPFGVMMHVPELALRYITAESFFRTHGRLSPAERELVTIATANEFGAVFAWSVHEPRARELGASPEAIAAIENDAPLEGLPQREQVLIGVVRSLLRTHRLADELFEQAMTELGRQQLVEVVALIGHYSLVALMLNAFEVPVEGVK